MKRALAAVAALAVAAILWCACGGAQSPRAALPGAKLLRNVPADTPYLMASLEPPPLAELERTTARTRKLVAAWRQQLGKDPSERPGRRLLQVMLDELEPNATIEGLDRLGFGANATVVVYGIGILPAIRIVIKDGRAVEATVQRIVTKAGGPPPRQGPHGARWEFPIGPRATVVLAVTADELLAAVLPTRDLDRNLALLYGDSHLGPSLADSPRVGELMTRHRLSPRLVGWLDLDAAVKAVADKNGPVPEQLLALTGSSKTSPACLAEVTGLVAHVPRMVFGMQEITATRQHGMALIELDPDLIRDFASLRTTAVGVGAPLGTTIFSFGLGIDVPRAIEVLRARTHRVLERPYTCPQFLEWNELAGQLDQALAQTIPPWVFELRGIAIELIEMKMGGSFGPRARGVGVISATDPIRVIDIAKRFLPQLPSASPDGKPVKVPGGILFLDAWVALKGQLLGVAIGEGSELELVRIMSERPVPSQPLLSVAGDGKKLTEINTAMAKEGEPAPPTSPEGKFQVLLAPDPAGLRLDFEYEDEK